MASKIDSLLIRACRPTMRATGAAVMTAMSMKTPTAQMTRVATAIAGIARFAPRVETIVSAIFCAAPDLINAPTRTPDVKTRRIGDAIFCAPETIASTVSVNAPPPRIPPRKAPKINE